MSEAIVPNVPNVPKVPIALPAATLTLVRDGVSGPEVLMMQRNLKSKFVPGAYIFPGGRYDFLHRIYPSLQ